MVTPSRDGDVPGDLTWRHGRDGTVTRTQRETGPGPADPGRAPTGPRPTGPRPMVMLVTATIGFAVNFWAWALLSPLGRTGGRPAPDARGGAGPRRQGR